MLACRPLWYCLGQLEILVLLFVAKIKRCKQLLKAHYLRPFGGQLSHLFRISGYILLLVGDTRHLCYTYFDFH